MKKRGVKERPCPSPTRTKPHRWMASWTENLRSVATALSRSCGRWRFGHLVSHGTPEGGATEHRFGVKVHGYVTAYLHTGPHAFHLFDLIRTVGFYFLERRTDLARMPGMRHRRRDGLFIRNMKIEVRLFRIYPNHISHGIQGYGPQAWPLQPRTGA